MLAKSRTQISFKTHTILDFNNNLYSTISANGKWKNTEKINQFQLPELDDDHNEKLYLETQ